MKSTQSRGRPRDFDEEEVLNIAMHYFWEHGYVHTSVDDLMQEMSIKKSSFYATFTSKEDLFARCLDLYTEAYYKNIRALEQKLGAKKALLSLTHNTLKEFKEMGHIKGCLLTNSAQECYNTHPILSQKISLDFNAIKDILTDLVHKAQIKGEIQSKKDASIIAGRYINALNGLILSMKASASFMLVKDLVLNLEEILD